MRKSQFSKKQKSAVVGATVAAIVAGGAAFAYWTTSGSGTGSASTSGGTSNLQYSDNSPSGLAPGVTPASLVVTVKNANAAGGQSAYVGGVSAYVTTPAGSGCNAAWYSINGNGAGTSSNPVALNWTPVNLAAQGAQASSVGGNTNTIALVDDSSTNQNACKGVTVTLNYASN